MARSAEFAQLLAGADCKQIVLELTEHTRVSSYPALREALQRLRDMGCRLAVDDAGSGYASFSHILQLAPDVIKLDHA